MKTIVATLLTVVLVTGCARTFYHPHKPTSAFERDKRECWIEGEERAANLGEHGNPILIQNLAVDCLEAKGWQEQ